MTSPPPPANPPPEPPAISAAEAAAAFCEHIMRKAAAARQRYGPCIGPDEILAMLQDPEVVRYPTTVDFDGDQLQPGEFAWPRSLGFHASDGYCLLLHPHFRATRQAWPLLIAYHIPTINYGPIAEPQHAELFAATLLGMEPEDYYQAICQLADSVPRPHSAAAIPHKGR